MVAAEDGDPAHDVEGFVPPIAEPDHRVRKAARELGLAGGVPEGELVADAAELEAQRGGDLPGRRRPHVGPRAEIAELLGRREEEAERESRRRGGRHAGEQTEEDADGGGVVVGAGAARHRVVVGDQH